MKLCVIHPGATSSVSDVYTGLIAGLRAHGHEVIQYNLSGRLAYVGAFLDFVWKKAKREGRNMERPNIADLLYQAGGDAIIRALHHMPDWVIVVSALYYPRHLMGLLRNTKSFKIGLLLTESPYDDEAQEKLATRADVVWTNERTSVERLRIACPHTYYLPHGYDVTKHGVELREPDEDETPAHDVVFVGTCFAERIELLSQVNWDGIDFGLYGNWQDLGSRSKLRKHIRGGQIDNRVAASLYRKAKIGLNLHRQSKGFGRMAPRITHAESLNPRAYELAACGAFHISDMRAELAEVFGELVPTFTDAADLESKIRDWLVHDARRAYAREQLPGAVLGHDWHDRAARLVEDLERYPMTGVPRLVKAQ